MYRFRLVIHRRIRNADLHGGVVAEFVRFLLVMILFAAPGVMAATLLWPAIGAGERAVRGVCLGWAFLVLTAGTIGYLGLWMVWPVFGIGAAAIAILCWMRRRSGQPAPLLVAKPAPLDVSLLLVLLIAGVARFAA